MLIELSLYIERLKLPSPSIKPVNAQGLISLLCSEDKVEYARSSKNFVLKGAPLTKQSSLSDNLVISYTQIKGPLLLVCIPPYSFLTRSVNSYF